MTDAQWEQASSFWTRKTASEKQMGKEKLSAWIDAFLGAHNVLALATGSGDHLRCTPLEYRWHDNALWILSEGGRKFSALRENRLVAATVFETDTTFSNLQALQVEGMAEIEDNTSEDYRKETAYRHIPVSALRNLAEPLWLIKITPTSITCLNTGFTAEGFSARQIWQG